jgi:hypothetical protein
LLCFGWCQENEAVSLDTQREDDDHYGEPASEMIFTPRWYTVAQVAQLLNMGTANPPAC